MIIQWSFRPENIINLDEDHPSPLNQQFEDLYLIKVFSEIITPHQLDGEYHALIANYLFEGVARGFGGHIESFGELSLQAKTLKALRRNIYIFSAAKQYQQVRILSKFINIAGEKSTFDQFKKLASKVFDEFNKNYLKTEYITAVGQSQMARDWVEFQIHKHQFPILEYRTQHDGRVREAHAMLEGIKRHVDDSFWNSYMPKNGWRCRCFAVAKADIEETDLSKINLPKFGTSEFPEVFKMNLGKDKLIFKPDHPYFSVPKREKSFKKSNFGMVIP